MEVWGVLSAVVAGLCTGLMGVALARLPKTSVANPVYCFVLSAFLWAVGDLIAQASTDMGWKQVGLAIFYTGAIALPALWWMVALRWSEEVGANLPFRAPAWTQVPLAFAALMWLFMITNPWHGAFITPVVGGRNVYQPLWYVMGVPSYMLIAAALAVELEVARRLSSQEVRRQAGFLVAASLVTMLSSLIYVSGFVSVNLTSLVLSVSGALLLVGMAREGLFGVFPLVLPAIAADHPDGLVVVGVEGQLRYANARAHDLLAPIELQPDARVIDLLRDARLEPESPELDQGAADEQWWEVLVGLGGTTFHLNRGSTRWLHVTASAVNGRRGGIKGFCLQISDRTTQKQAELRVRQVRRLESVAAFARKVSRDLQDICSTVYANGELLSVQSALAPKNQRKVSRIIDASKRGVELAYELQLYTGTFTTRRVLLELCEIVEETCEFVEDELPHGVELTYVGADEELSVYVDAFQIRQSIFSLLMNAIEAMAEGYGEIEVRTGCRYLDPAREDLICGGDQSAGEYAYVRIRDEGSGMDPATQERAFEPFFSTHGKDRGEGLPTVLGIARAHGALLTLENDQGCVFTLYFPLERGAGTA